MTNLSLVNLTETRGRGFTPQESLQGRQSNSLRSRKRMRALLEANHFKNPLIQELMMLIVESDRYRREICDTAGVARSAIDNMVRHHRVSLMTVQCLAGALGYEIVLRKRGESNGR